MPASPRGDEELQHAEIDTFVSGPLDLTAGTRDRLHHLFPPGYCPPSLSKHRSRNVPPGMYSGNVTNGKPDGFGSATWPGARKFDGQWRGGLEHGVGREAWITGSSYSGGFVDGLRSGFGVYSHCASPGMFQMLRVDALDSQLIAPFEWCNTLPYSQKWATAKSGWVYAGQMRYGGRHGFGALATSDGELYEGHFHEDKKHGFGVRMVRNRALWLEAYDEGECRMSYSPLEREGLTVHVEASLNRLRWSAVKLSLSWHNGVASITLLDKMTGAPLGSRVMVPDIISLKIGDPITHSFILQYTDSERVKKTLEIQAGSDAAFRLIFLALRIVIYEHRVGQPLTAPFDAEWFKDLSGQDPSKLLGRFVRGSEGLDERFFQKVRESVSRAESEHRKAFYYSCLAYVKMTISASAHLHKVWGISRDDTFQVTYQEFADPDEWLLEQSGTGKSAMSSPASLSPWRAGAEWGDDITEETVTEVLLDRAIVFLRRCDSLIAGQMEMAAQKRASAEHSNDKGAARTHEVRLSHLEAKQRWASETVQTLEQGAEFVHNALASCFAHLSFSPSEVADVASAVDSLATPKAEMRADRSVTLSPQAANDSVSPEESGVKSPSRTKYAAHDMSHSIMMRRSAITTAMLLQSRRQREIVDLEYAEAERLLKDAKSQLEQSQAAQRAITLEMKQRAETSETECSKLQLLYAQATAEAQAASARYEREQYLHDEFRNRAIALIRSRLEAHRKRDVLRAWHFRAKRGVHMIYSAQKTILRWFRFNLTRAFMTWQRAMAARKRLTAKARSTILKMAHSKLYSAWHTWIDMAQRATRLRDIGRRVISRWRNMLLAEAFDVWNYQLPSRNLAFQVEKRLSTEVQLAQLLQDHQDLLARLLKAEEELQRHRDRVEFLSGKSQQAAQSVLSKWLKMPMTKCFHKWCAWVYRGLNDKAKFTKVVSRWAGMTKDVTFALWRDVTVYETKLVRSARKIMARWFFKTTYNSFTLWHTHSCELAGMRKKSKSVLRRWMNSTLLGSLHKWMEEVKRIKAFRKILLMWNKRSLVPAWHKWIEAVQTEKKHQTILLRWKNRALIPSWHRWVEHIGELRRNRAILKRWMNRPLARIFLRWVEHFVEIRRQLAVIKKIIMRMMKQNIARAFYLWSSNVGEDVRIKIIFTKVLLRWTRHGLKMAFYKWHLTVVQEIRDMQILYKIAMRWSNMTICSAFMTWHENTSAAIGRARDAFQRFAAAMIHAEKEKEPFAMFSDTISLQIAKMKEHLGIKDTEGIGYHDENDEMPIIKAQSRKATRSARAPPPPPARSGNASSVVVDDLPLIKIKGDSDDLEVFSHNDDLEVFSHKKAVRAQRSAGPGVPMGSLIQDEYDLQSVFKSTPSKATPEHTHEKLVFDIKWNTIFFEKDIPVTIENVKLEQRPRGKGLARFKRAVRSIIMARRFQAGAARVGISITNEPPHVVLKVTELMDGNGRLQGQSGYTNPTMKPGDVMYAINGTHLNTLPIGGVKEALFGPPNSTVKLHMRRQDGSSYEVIAMRHMAITQAGIEEMNRRNQQRQQQRSVMGQQGAVRTTAPSAFAQHSSAIYRSQDSYNASIYRSSDSTRSAPHSAPQDMGNPWMNAISNIASALGSPPTGTDHGRTASISPLSMFSSPPIGSSVAPGVYQQHGTLSSAGLQPSTYGGQPSYPGHAPTQQAQGEYREFGRIDAKNNSVLF